MNSMLQNSRHWLFATALAGLSALQGCVFDVDDDHDHDHLAPVGIYEGNLIVDWTIARAKEPLECDANDAYDIAIDITTPSGRPITTIVEDCRAFETVIALEEGDYAGSAVLLDPGGFERTTAVQLGQFSIFADSDTVVPIDFPFSSFL